MRWDDRPYEPSAGVVHAALGVAVIGVAAMSLVNSNEHTLFGVLGLVLGASGTYLLVAGAVARGIQLAALQQAAARGPARARRPD